MIDEFISKLFMEFLLVELVVNQQRSSHERRKNYSTKATTRTPVAVAVVVSVAQKLLQS